MNNNLKVFFLRTYLLNSAQTLTGRSELVQAIINLISGGQIATSWGVLIAFVTIGVGFTGALQVICDASNRCYAVAAYI